MASKSKTKAKKKNDKHGANKAAWKLLDRGAGVAASVIAVQGATLIWRAATGRKPPSVTRHPELPASEAVTWSVLAATSIAIARVAMNRGAVNYWVKSTGELPPGMKSLDKMESDTAKRKAKKRRKAAFKV